MLDKRCPMCGKLNLPNADVCQFCQARLTPVNLTPEREDTTRDSDQAPTSNNISGLESDQPDWLSSFRGIDEPEQESGQEEDGDWLSGFRSQPEGLSAAKEDKAPPSRVPAVTPESGEEPEDWLRSILPQDELKKDEGVEPDDIPLDDSDWLSRIGAESDQPSSDTGESVPDWLSEMGKSSVDMEPPGGPDRLSQEAEESPDAQEKELPDWLAGEGSGVPDWLAESQEAKPETSSAPQPPKEDGSKLPDWLAGEGELPDWLSQPSDVSSAPASAPQALEEGEPELPDWLAQVGPAGSPESPAEGRGEARTAQAPGEEGEVELPDWLAREDQELPDWLASTTAETPASTSAAQPEQGIEPELPDWLTQASEEGPAAISAEDYGAIHATQAPGGEEEAELPDWLAQPVDEMRAAPAEPQGIGEGEPELPDWLTQAEAGIPGEGPFVSHEAPAPGGAGEPELPDWLAQGAAEMPGASSEIQPSEPGAAELPDWLAGEDKGLPDWLASEDLSEWTSEEKMAGAGMGLQAANGEQAMPAAEGEYEFEFPEWMETGPKEEPLQEQVADLAETSQFTDTGSDQDEMQLGEDLTWLEELEYAFPEMPTAAEVSTDRNKVIGKEDQGELESSYGEPLPDWLTEAGEVSEEEVLEATAPQAEGEEPDITPAKLPSWLEAMRPVGIAGVEDELAKEIAEKPVEGAGPLAGLRGVLPAEPDVSQSIKPPVYTVKLQVTDLQKTQAELLSRLIQQEGEEAPIPGRPVITTQHVLRLVIAALLILSILLPITTGLPQMAAPEIVPEVNETSLLIGGLPAAAPVLLAIDYEPGLSGEMDAIASPILDHLMIKGAFLALVSTTPTGAMQAENLIAQVNRRGGHQYVDSSQYVNLGFIPGGTLGLLALAEAPRKVLPVDMNGNPTWNNPQLPALQNIGSLSDFAMLIVATENPDTARAWIEQVQPRLAGKPMILLLSAQAEPMVRPYYEAAPRQVQGLVSGLAASASYETLLGGRRGSASQYWSAFSIGMLVAGLLIVSGGLVNALSAHLRGGKESQEGER
jgi:hypothetical protein